MQGKYLLFAHPQSYVFTLRQEGENWEREFHSVLAAVTYAGTQPDSEDATVIVFNASGERMVEVNIHEPVLAAA